MTTACALIGTAIGALWLVASAALCVVACRFAQRAWNEMLDEWQRR